jgi:hypothetical protein
MRVRVREAKLLFAPRSQEKRQGDERKVLGKEAQIQIYGCLIRPSF